MDLFQPYRFVLASGSPRRIGLLEKLGIPFEVKPVGVDENYPGHLEREAIPLYLSDIKAEAFPLEDQPAHTIVIAADTIVWLDGRVIGKPVDEEDARHILRTLSDRTHEVITGVCIRSKTRKRLFHVISEVTFGTLTDPEIDHYIRTCKPFDKAGAYGIQEWIGLIGIESIRGSYLNVVGLPVQRLYHELEYFLEAK